MASIQSPSTGLGAVTSTAIPSSRSAAAVVSPSADTTLRVRAFFEAASCNDAKWLAAEGGMAEAEMLKTFNAGIGMVAVVSADKVDAAKAAFAEDGHAAIEIGRITTGNGVTYSGALL